MFETLVKYCKENELCIMDSNKNSEAQKAKIHEPAVA